MCRFDSAECTDPSNPTTNESFICNVSLSSPQSEGVLVAFLMLNHDFRQCVVHEGFCPADAKAVSCWQHLSLSLCLCPIDEPGAPLKPCSSSPSPNCRAPGRLLFIAVKALTPYCAVVSGWIQLRALLCSSQLFYAWVGWLGGSGSGHIFRIRLDGLTVSLCSVRFLLAFSFS